MKNIIGFVACILLGVVNAQETDWVRQDLRGRVKSVTEVKTKAMIRVNHIEKYQQEYNRVSEFREDGLLQAEKFFDEENLPTYTVNYIYNETNQLIHKDIDSYNQFLKIDEIYTYEAHQTKITVTENEVAVQERIQEFDAYKNLLSEKMRSLEEEGIFVNEENKYNEQNQLTSKRVNYDHGEYEIRYSYNAKGLLTKEEVLVNGEVSTTKMRQYNEQNDLIAEKQFDQSMKLNYSVEIKYAYDQHNNWITRTQYHHKLDAPISNTTRQIVYY
ncbi:MULTISPECIES: hypothetical protein [Weeksella]|uniref:hypothetical protein n=1 Tax=Weeksella TaxID=1013 RepID=UPI0008A4541D|nr:MULTISPECIES: hypothetical protein [Weeksella]MDK7375500.1 hypothetical protein [Weeksella virosa]OFM84287.1 hypothetical protein HMPREF2660_08820 [Weeksella sp. HMSC059D05]